MILANRGSEPFQMLRYPVYGSDAQMVAQFRLKQVFICLFRSLYKHTRQKIYKLYLECSFHAILPFRTLSINRAVQLNFNYMRFFS